MLRERKCVDFGASEALESETVSPTVSTASQMREKSAFRPCGRDLVEFFNSTGWAFPVKLTPNRPTSGWAGYRYESRANEIDDVGKMTPQASSFQSSAASRHFPRQLAGRF